MIGWVILSILFLNAGSLAANWRIRRALRKATAKAEAQWREAVRYAEVSHHQAQVIGECTDLMCDDCRAIVHGHYMAKAYPRVQAMIDDEGRR